MDVLVFYCKQGISAISTLTIQPAESHKQHQQEDGSIEVMEWKTQETPVRKEGLVMDKVNGHGCRNGLLAFLAENIHHGGGEFNGE